MITELMRKYTAGTLTYMKRTLSIYYIRRGLLSMQEAIYEKAGQVLKDIDIKINTGELEITVDFINIENFEEYLGFGSHMHSNYEFHYIKSGRGTVEIEGVLFELQSKSFYVCAPNALHKQVADKENPMLEYAMMCSISPVENKEMLCCEGSAILETLRKNSSCVVTDKQNIEKLFENIFNEAVDKKTGYFMQIKNYVLHIIAASARNLDTSRSLNYIVPGRNADSHRMKLIEEYINDNLSRSISCKELSRQFYLSEKQLNRVIRNNTGMSTHEYIMELKLLEARKLIHDINIPLREIAEKVGFANEFHLSSRFKKHTGVSPKAYRKRFA